MRNPCPLLVLLACWLLTACTPFSRASSEEADSTVAVSESDLTEQARLWADSVYSRMTVRERVGQLLMPALYASDHPYNLKMLRWYADSLRVGGILLLKGEVASAAAIADSLASFASASPKPFLAVDAETGLGMRFSDAPLFPWNSDIDRQADENDFFDYGAEVGREARLLGINMVLGPVVDIDRSETEGRGVMKKRSLGSDQLRVSDLSLAYARGLESRGVMSVVKHFPGHGPTKSDSHESLPVISTPADELFAIDLMPFRTAVQNGLSCIMVGHIWAPGLDSVRRPASFSPVVIGHLLREQMGFRGLVIVDAMGMGAAKGFSSVDAVNAGADIIIAPAATEREIEALEAVLADGSLPEGTLADACKRILFYKYIFSVGEPAFEPEERSHDILKERLREEAPRILDILTHPAKPDDEGKF